MMLSFDIRADHERIILGEILPRLRGRAAATTTAGRV